MKHQLQFALSLFVVLGLVSILRAGSDQVTLKGTMACAHCQMHEGTACQSVLTVKNGDKTDKYYLTANDVSKPTHSAVCKASKDNVTITGTVTEKDGKKWITASKIEGLG